MKQCPTSHYGAVASLQHTALNHTTAMSHYTTGQRPCYNTTTTTTAMLNKQFPVKLLCRFVVRVNNRRHAIFRWIKLLLYLLMFSTTYLWWKYAHTYMGIKLLILLYIINFGNISHGWYILQNGWCNNNVLLITIISIFFIRYIYIICSLFWLYFIFLVKYKLYHCIQHIFIISENI